jgi:hemerythrin-like domain-containing protein
MKRHPALVPLSHDHHHALVEARRLRRAADSPESVAVATAFLRFFADDTVRHFREEEELLFPSVVEFEEARELLVQALLEHQRLHALTAQLQHSVTTGGAVDDLMRELGDLLEAHVRLEERQLFPLIERLLKDVTGLLPAERDDVDAARHERRRGAVRGIASDELNATLLSWNAGTGPPEHVNEERDVLVVVLDGSATVRIDEEERALARGETAIIGKGRKAQDHRRPRWRALSLSPSAPAATPDRPCCRARRRRWGRLKWPLRARCDRESPSHAHRRHGRRVEAGLRTNGVSPG